MSQSDAPGGMPEGDHRTVTTRFAVAIQSVSPNGHPSAKRVGRESCDGCITGLDNWKVEDGNVLVNDASTDGLVLVLARALVEVVQALLVFDLDEYLEARAGAGNIDLFRFVLGGK